jgi:hypothetical protein
LIFLCPSQSVRSPSIPLQLRFVIRFPFKKSHLKEKVLDIYLSQPECEVTFYSATIQICDKVSL